MKKKNNKFAIPELLTLFKNNRNYLVLLVYSVGVMFVALNHEPWFDEAQAWLIAKDLNIIELFNHLRFEGHPPLWYLLLKLFILLGFKYKLLNCISAFISIFTVYIFLEHSPFPYYLKVLFPFGFYMFYQNGVVSRSYVLMPLILFLIATIYNRRSEKIFLFTFLLIILSYISFYGLALSIALLAIYNIDLLKQEIMADHFSSKKHFFATILFLFFLVLFFLLMIPPTDLFVAGGRKINPLIIVSNVLSEEPVLSLIFFGFIVIWLESKGNLLLLIVMLCSQFLAFLLAFKLWHEALIFYIFIFSIWVSWHNKSYLIKSVKNQKYLNRMMEFSLFLILSIHIGWNIITSRNDLLFNYSANKSVARFLKEHELDKRSIFPVGYYAQGVLPYFEKNIFTDQFTRFWDWSYNNPMIFEVQERYTEKRVLSYKRIIETKLPDVILFGIKSDIDKELLTKTNIERNYLKWEVFKGNMFWKTGLAELESYIIFIKKDLCDSNYPEI